MPSGDRDAAAIRGFLAVLVPSASLVVALFALPLATALLFATAVFGAAAIWAWRAYGDWRNGLVAAIPASLALAAALAVVFWPSGSARSLEARQLAAVRLVEHELLVTDMDLRIAAGSAIPATVLPLATVEWASYRDTLAVALPPNEWEQVARYYDLAAAANGNPASFVDHGRRLVLYLRHQLGQARRVLAGYAAVG